MILLIKARAAKDQLRSHQIVFKLSGSDKKEWVMAGSEPTTSLPSDNGPPPRPNSITFPS